MNRKTLGRIFILVLLAGAMPGVGIAGAQTAPEGEDAALVMLMEGDLWLWREMPPTFEQLTTTGHNAQLALAPDGKQVAYTSVAEVGREALESPGGVGDSPLPVDIWVLDIESKQASTMARQPADASYMAEGVADNFITRSAPSWSPDGAYLVWMEFSFAAGDYQLVTYAVASGETQVIVPALPAQAGVPGIRDPLWGLGGIAVRLTVPNAAGDGAEEAILVYDASGALKAEARLSAGDDGTVVDCFWVSDGAKDYVGVAYSSGSWVLVDPETGDARPLTGTPEQYSLAFPEASGKMAFAPALGQEAGLRFAWLFTSASGDQTWELPFTGGPQQVALSTTGQTVAYIGDEGIYIWRDGQTGKIAGTEPAGGDPTTGVVWGVTGWRVASTAVVVEPGAGPEVEAPTTQAATPLAPTVPDDFECPGAPSPRLTVGGQGRVTPGTPNRMRAEPGGRYVRDIPAGGTFDVLDGPVCEDGFVWWRVNYRGTEGWTAEGQGEQYWLEPAP